MSLGKNSFTELPQELTMEEKIDMIFKSMAKAETDRSDLKKQLAEQSSMIENLVKRVSIAEETSKRVPVLENSVTKLFESTSNNKDNITILLKKNKEIEKKMEELLVAQKKMEWDLSLKNDDLEQHDRNELIYLNGVVVDEDNEKLYGHRQAAMMAVDEVLRPLIDANKNTLKMPTEKWGDYLKNAHCLPIPEKAPAGSYKCKPILARFKFRSLKDFILSNKDKLAVRQVDLNLGTTNYSLSAALTKKRYAFLSDLLKSKHWFKVWHIDGKHIKMIKRKGDPVKKVKFFEFTKEELMAM